MIVAVICFLTSVMILTVQVWALGEEIDKLEKRIEQLEKLNVELDGEWP